MRHALAIATLVLAGCKTLPPPVEVVPVTVKEIVPVPEELTRPCDPVPKRGNSYGEMKRVVNARAASLEECSGRMKKIRDLKAEVPRGTS